jgi:hypothetical protein
VLCAWVVVVMARSLRGRPSQVKGAFGVANAMPLRGTLDLRASTAPPGSITGRRGPALHHARHHHNHPRTQHNHAQKQQRQQHPKTKTPDLR